MKSKLVRMGLVLTTALLMLFGTLNAALAWTLSGTVYGGSNPLASATVKLNDAATAALMGTTTTDASGFYTFTVSDGSYNLTITPPGGSGFSESVVNGVPVSGDVTQSVVLVQQAVLLSGVVKTASGVLLDRVYVGLYDQVSGTKIGDDYFTTTNGQYSFGVAPGTYRIQVSSYGSTTLKTPNYWHMNPVVSNLSITGPKTQDVVIPFVAMSGKTTDSNGIPVGGVETRVYKYWNINASSYNVRYDGGRSVSDASGNYSMNLLPYTYDVSVLPPTASGMAQTIFAGVEVTGNTARDFAANAAITLSGVVKTASGVLLDRVYVGLYDQVSGTKIGDDYFTTTNGQYSFGVAPGTYRIQVSSYGSTTLKTPNYWHMNPVVSNVSITGPKTQDVVIPFVAMSGKTTDSNGIPVGGVETRVYKYWNTNASSYNVRYDGGRSVSDASGNYSMNLLPYTYDVSVLPPTASGLAQTIFAGVEVTGNSARDFAANAAITLSGVVKTSSGVLLDRVYVGLYDQVSGTKIGDDYFTTTNGQYSFGVAPGTYRIQVSSYGSTTLKTPNYWHMNPVVSNLSITGPKTQDVVIPFVTMSGKTTDSNGVPVGGVETRVYKYWNTNASSYNVRYDGGRSVSDTSGDYIMNLLPYTYDETILPPNLSGFAQTQVNGINVTTGILQNIILAMPDTVAPLILSGPVVSAIKDTTATIEWQTNEPAKGGVTYGTSNPPGTTVAESTFKTLHSHPLSGLTANTTYYVKVSASDAANNGPTTSSVISFTTRPLPDITPPMILNGPTVTAITHTSAAVEWTTNEPSTGSVVYGLATLPDQTLADPTLATTHRLTLTGLTPETIYYLNATATDAASNGPASTPTISFRTVATPDTMAPVIVEGPMATNISNTGATIIWKTDEPATSGVSWNDGTTYGVLSDDTLTTTHSVRITGLISSTLYSFTVSSKDTFNNGPILSKPATFTTLPTADTKPPVITLQPIVKNVNHQMALIYWETDESASSVIEYGTTEALGTTDAQAALGTKHNRPLTGLEAGTTYYFRVFDTDAFGNNSEASPTYSFTTDLLPNTKVPVVTTAPAIIYKTDTAGTVYFETDVPCDTVVEFGEGSTLTNRHSDGEKVNKHQATITNLNGNTSYGVQVSCTDMDGNTVVAKAGKPSSFLALNVVSFLSDMFVNIAGTTGFMTQSLPDTTTPLITAGPTVIGLTDTKAVIYWETDEIADSRLSYGLGQELTLFSGDIEQTTEHVISLTNLSPSATYSYQVGSQDPSGNGPVTSSTAQFTTASAPDTTAPVISAISIVPTNISAVLSWTTNEAATSKVLFGTDETALTSQVTTNGMGTAHSLTVTNLQPGTTYYLSVASQDVSLNEATSSRSFATNGGSLPTFILTTSAGSGGSISPATEQTVTSSASTNFTITPDDGFQLAGVSGCNGTLSSNTYTVTNLTANCTITASFAAIPPPAVNGVCGSDNDQSLTAAPVNLCTTGTATTVLGTGPWSWSCGGTDNGSTAICTANMATPAIPQFAVTPTADNGCTINPAKAQSVNQNGTASFTVTPLPGYGILSVSGCGGSLSANTYTTGPITADCSIAVTAVARTATSGSTSEPTILDAWKVLLAVEDIATLTAAEQIRFDVAPLGSGALPLGNGTIDAADVILILRRSIGIGNW